MSDSTTIEQKKKKKSAVNTKNELKQHVSDYHLDSNGDKIKKDTIEPNDTLRTVIGDADQGYYNTGWFKNDLSACWSYIPYPKKDQLNITESVCVNTPLEVTVLNLEMIECPPLNKFSVPIQWEIKVLCLI